VRPRHLAQFEFEGRNEAEIRGDWIEPLLRLLGYGLGTRNSILREHNLALQPAIRQIGSARIEIDFIPTVFGKRLWIIEAKRPQGGEDLFSDAHLGQAWSYATDPRIDVRFIVLCDGTRLGVFDLSGPEWTKPVFDGPKAELPERFGKLEELLGARRIAEWIGRRQLRHLRSALEAQIDLDALEQAQAEVEAMVTELRPVVQGRREEIREEARRRVRERGGEALDRAGIWGHAQHLNGPLIPSKGDVGRAVELVRRQPAALRIREFANFRQSSIPAGEEQPRMWFTLRLVELGAAVWLVEDEACGEYCRELAEAAAASHASGFVEDPLQAAAYRLQRALGPLGWRLAILAKTGGWCRTGAVRSSRSACARARTAAIRATRGCRC
jgi:hypothetical protein